MHDFDVTPSLLVDVRPALDGKKKKEYFAKCWKHHQSLGHISGLAPNIDRNLVKSVAKATTVHRSISFLPSERNVSGRNIFFISQCHNGGNDCKTICGTQPTFICFVFVVSPLCKTLPSCKHADVIVGIGNETKAHNGAFPFE